MNATTRRESLVWTNGRIAPAILTVLMGLTHVACAQEIVDPQEAKTDPDFAVQGEYVGEGTLADGSKAKVGAHVIAMGDSEFDIVVYRGGLPGDGWKRGDNRLFMKAKGKGGSGDIQGDGITGTVAGGKLSVTSAGNDGKLDIRLEKTERKSPSLGAKPPEGAVVLFDGTDVKNFPGATLTEMKTLQAGTKWNSQQAISKFHLEFRLSYKPKARGQGRSNSGVFLGGCPEIQVLDSFGLEGRKNECGALYNRREPDVNMCFPPLIWQTYDVEFAPIKDDDGNATAKTGFTVRHNGVVVHPDYQVGGKPSDPRGLSLQKHGNRVQYRNIWLLP